MTVDVVFRTIIKVNRGPVELTVRNVFDGTRMPVETISFPGTGPQQDGIGGSTRLTYSSAVSQYAEVLTPKSLKSNTAEALIKCS
jgi:hypothetical protein